MVVFQYHDEGTTNVKKNGIHSRIFLQDGVKITSVMEGVRKQRN